MTPGTAINTSPRVSVARELLQRAHERNVKDSQRQQDGIRDLLDEVIEAAQSPDPSPDPDAEAWCQRLVKRLESLQQAERDVGALDALLRGLEL